MSIPSDWIDNSVNVFRLPQSNGSAATFVVTRESASPGVAVSNYADQQLVDCAKKLTGYKLLERQQTALDGQEAIRIDYSWTSQDGTDVRQRQLFVARKDVFLIFTLSSRADHFEQNEFCWIEILKSVRLTRG